MKSKKGGEFEREIAKLLSKWLGSSDDLVWRTAGSGARATSRAKKYMSTANSGGDLCLLDPNNEIAKNVLEVTYWELKRGYTQKRKAKEKKKSISITDIMDKPSRKGKRVKSLIEEWWSKIMDESERDNKIHPILLYRRDFRTAVIVLHYGTYEYIVKTNGQRHWSFPGDGHCCFISLEDGTMICFFNLEDFIDWCNPKAFYRRISLIKRRSKTIKPPNFLLGKYIDDKVKDILCVSPLPKKIRRRTPKKTRIRRRIQK